MSANKNFFYPYALQCSIQFSNFPPSPYSYHTQKEQTEVEKWAKPERKLHQKYIQFHGCTRRVIWQLRIEFEAWVSDIKRAFSPFQFWVWNDHQNV